MKIVITLPRPDYHGVFSITGDIRAAVQREVDMLAPVPDEDLAEMLIGWSANPDEASPAAIIMLVAMIERQYPDFDWTDPTDHLLNLRASEDHFVLSMNPLSVAVKPPIRKKGCSMLVTTDHSEFHQIFDIDGKFRKRVQPVVAQLRPVRAAQLLANWCISPDVAGSAPESVLGPIIFLMESQQGTNINWNAGKDMIFNVRTAGHRLYFQGRYLGGRWAKPIRKSERTSFA